MEKIIVPFDKKARAQELGAIFEKKGDRGWYIPAGASAEIAEKLRNLAKEDPEKGREELKKEPENIYPGNELHIEEPLVPIYSDISNTDWQEIIKNGNSLYMALAINKYGMPNEEKHRIEILKLFALRRDGEYPISYEGILNCSDSFAHLYPIEKTTELIKRCIKGERNYIDEIKNSDLTEEEKALMFFVLPL